MKLRRDSVTEAHFILTNMVCMRSKLAAVSLVMRGVAEQTTAGCEYIKPQPAKPKIRFFSI